ncbi:MAG TPA: histidine kinase [Saprospiraceae bacterium]|nr:histidine kinase [Saprospiraceae bacterium]
MSINRDRFKLYIWIGLAYLSLWLLSNLVSETATFLVRIPNELWRLAYVIVLNFIFFEYTLPYIFSRRGIFLKIVVGLLLIWIQLMFYSFGLYGWRSLGILLHIYTPLRTDATITEGVTYHFPYSVGSIFFFGIITHIYDYITLRQTAQRLRIEKQEAELNYLKSQTNPHFLFNTLNNIYSLARDKSDLAPESILRLSKILRFMLYETGGAFIAIEQELKIMNDYLALEKLRYDDSLRVNFNYDLEDLKQSIPPLLLMPLVENAFKHGVSETRHQPFVDIHLSVNQRQLTFTVKNSSDKFPGELGVKENIGLSNLRRQLELLYRDYTLTVQQGESVFTAILKINLVSHV